MYFNFFVVVFSKINDVGLVEVGVSTFSNLLSMKVLCKKNDVKLTLLFSHFGTLEENGGGGIHRMLAKLLGNFVKDIYPNKSLLVY